MPKKQIPKALREQVWKSALGPVFESKCVVSWCQNTITVFDFEVGHNLPESKGGATSLENLRPICGRCNKSMGNRYSIDEWNRLGQPIGSVPTTGCVGCC
jgi:5-methylcytosine-specific restriction endonuclease McrA